jgi:hypothetical protein
MAHSYAAVIYLLYETSVLTVKLRGRRYQFDMSVLQFLLYKACFSDGDDHYQHGCNHNDLPCVPRFKKIINSPVFASP